MKTNTFFIEEKELKFIPKQTIYLDRAENMFRLL